VASPASLLRCTAPSGTSGCAMALDGAPRTRREAVVGAAAAAAAAALAAVPGAGHASYALYQASYDSYDERKKTGYVPVATNDRESLAQIQEDILKKRPQSAMKAKKPGQYCAGQTSAVSPFLENICSNIGVSKADQSNTMSDDFGNMNIGVYNSLSAADKMKAEARQQMVREAAENARLRAQAARR